MSGNDREGVGKFIDKTTKEFSRTASSASSRTFTGSGPKAKNLRVSATAGQRLADVVMRPPLILALCGLALFRAVTFLALGRRAYRNDFDVFYSAATAYRHGLNPYTLDLIPIGQRLGFHLGALHHSTDTPTALLFFLPFSFPAVPSAYSLWITINLAAFAVALILLLAPRFSGLESRTALVIAALAILYAPTNEDFLFSQRQTVILLVLVLMMRALEKRREAAAGLLFSLAVAYRAFPILIAGYFVLRRQWRVLIYMGCGLTLVGAATVAMLGLPVCISYASGARFAATAFWYDPANVSLHGFLDRLFFYAVGPAPSWLLQILHFVTVASAETAILALAVWPTYQRRQRPGLDRPTYALWVASSIILSPLSWIHYMVLLLIPFAEIARAAEKHDCSSRAAWAAVASYLIISLASLLREPTVGASLWDQGVRYLAEGSTIALLLGFLAAVWLAMDTTGSAVSDCLENASCASDLRSLSAFQSVATGS